MWLCPWEERLDLESRPAWYHVTWGVGLWVLQPGWPKSAELFWSLLEDTHMFIPDVHSWIKRVFKFCHFWVEFVFIAVRIACSATPSKQPSKTWYATGNRFFGIDIDIQISSWQKTWIDSDFQKFHCIKSTTEVSEWCANSELENRIGTIQEFLGLVSCNKWRRVSYLEISCFTH